MSPATGDYIDSILFEPGFEDMTLNGDLVHVHLDENRLGIYCRPARRVLDCFYNPELEDLVVENLKGIVHVTGKVQLDASE